MAARALDNLFSLEREVVSLFGRCTGVDNIAVLKVTCASGTAEFAVGETVTAVGGAGGTGVVYAIRDVAGTWDIPTGNGTCVLDLMTITGVFTASDTLTGDIAGAATQNGASVADTVYPNPVSLKGKGVASVTCDISVAGTAGLYTVTLEDKWAGLLGFDACVMDATSPDEWQVVVVSQTVATTKTVVIQVFKGGAAADIQSDDKLYFEITLSNTQTLAGY